MINRELDSYSKWQNGAQTFSIFNALVLHTAGIFATIVQLGSTDYLVQQCLTLNANVASRPLRARRIQLQFKNVRHIKPIVIIINAYERLCKCIQLI